jgi:hypothetical protein
MSKELRSLSSIPQAEASTTAVTSSNDEGSPRAIHTAIEEAFFGPKSDVWRPAIYEVLMSFINRKAFKKQDKKQVIEQLRRKLMTTKWIFKEEINPDGSLKYKARCVSRGLCKYLELTIQSHLHQWNQIAISGL